MAGGNSVTGGRTSVRVVVAGDRLTGKSSLIAAAATETYPENVPPVLPPTRLPTDYFPDRIPITIVDTSPALENRGKLIEELKKADVVLLTYSCDQPLTLTRLRTFWLEELRRLEVKAPVIVVGCKLDLRDEAEPVTLEEVMGPIMHQFREIETCIECSAVTLMQVPDVFFYAQKAVLNPTAPLFDHENQALKPRCERALKRIFHLCDHDMDGALNDLELNNFQVKCFNAPLQPAEIVGVRSVVQEKKNGGVNELGLTLEGFIYLHSLFIDRGRIETTWSVLRTYGYNDELKLRDDLLPVPNKHAPDQSIELTVEAVEFLRGIFRLFDIDNRGALQPAEIDELFSTAPENPWLEAPYKDAAETTTEGNLTLKGFLSSWDLMTHLDPKGSLSNLIYVGYSGNPDSALRVTRRRKVNRKKQQTERNVFHCAVFGAKKAGKSALLHSFLERSFSASQSLPMGEQYAANIVNQHGGNKKTLVMHEVPEDEVKIFMANKESLAACDVAVFVYDCSNEFSWKRSCEMLMETARQGEETGHLLPCLLIAAKDDLDSYPMAVRDSLAVCQELGIEAPIPVSSRTGEMNNAFCRILEAAERPHVNIPETESCRKQKYFRHLVSHSLLFMSVGAAFTVAGLAAFRAYSARKNSSN
ncbi:mitochondrial Rho GTPase 2 isoform X2 [Mercurialis annua]|uniref:mitochondrial Rho GTPase 2 isoform X2 n=1 Tax=Mercurialis annua TaxID=3986 RepID=UPI00216040B2|nr:mitochondrial Rho GTPase 2 isoform X2 [Mercurialis annua]